ncbi:MAG TPA: o-succinylbenzoate synthase [Acidimicrobiales bacterium]|jgi:O-succinylbenzoate synthase|nr:o-succinylbenzoate synthase [Acidimicrobiales bacterium]
MRIEEVELLQVDLPLVRPFRTSFGTETIRQALVLLLRTDLGEGYGECVSGSEPLYSSEFVGSSWLTLCECLVPRLLLAGDLTAASVATVLQEIKGHRMAKAALEMAVLDAELRAAGQSLASRLGAVTDRVTPGVSVGIPDSMPELLDIVGGYLDEGYTRVKLKIEPGWDVEAVAAVRDRFGADLMLQVDANTAYSLSDLPRLRELDQFGLLLLEQPFDEEDLLSHVELARQVTTPVCLDETITSASLAIQAISLGACSVVNIKAGRVGGYLEAVRVHDACRQREIPVWCGGMLETGLGRAANLALGALPGFVLPGDISATDRYYKADITPPFVLEGGSIAVPAGPGLGVDIDVAVLSDLTSRRQVLTKSS